MARSDLFGQRNLHQQPAGVNKKHKLDQRSLNFWRKPFLKKAITLKKKNPKSTLKIRQYWQCKLFTPGNHLAGFPKRLIKHPHLILGVQSKGLTVVLDGSLLLTALG